MMTRLMTWMQEARRAARHLPALREEHRGDRDGRGLHEACKREIGFGLRAAEPANAERLSSAASELAGKDASEETRAPLRAIAELSGRLAQAQGLEATRGVYYGVSKPLVRYGEIAEGDVPVVVYCSMAKRSWLQPEGPIGNPYYGTSMLRCGKVVAK